MIRKGSALALLVLLVGPGSGIAAPIGFDPPVTYSSPATIIDVVLNDIDLDGDLDVVTTSYGFGTGVAIRFNLGGGTLSGETVYAPNGLNHYTLVADVNDDNLPDLVSTAWLSENLMVRLNLGAGVFGPVTSQPQTGQEPRCVAALDWEGDGDMDLAVAQWGANMVTVLRQTGHSLAFPGDSSKWFPTNYYPKWVTTGDLDGDGREEIVAASWHPGTLHVNRRDLAGNVTNVSYPTDTTVSMVVLARLDSDALLDVASVSENSKFAVRFGTGGGALSPLQTSYTTMADLSQGIAAGDFDSDGDTDLAISYYNASDVSVFENSGAGAFPTHAEFPSGPQARGIAAGDIDGDTDIDLVVTREQSASDQGFSILLNTLVPNQPTSVTTPEPGLALSRARVTSDPRNVAVSFSLRNNAPAKLDLFDISGRVRASRSLEGLGAGPHDVTLTTRNPLGPGVYFVRLTQEGSRVSRKFAVTR